MGASAIEPLRTESPEMLNLDRVAREYRQPDAGRQVDQKLIGLTADRMLGWMTGPDILECGSGDDQWTGRIIERFGHCHLVDGSRTLIEAARTKYGSRLTAYHALFEELVPNKQFDTILLSFVLEHVAEPPQVLARAATWLKPHGHLLIIVPHAGSLHRRLAVAMGLLRTPEELGPTDVRLAHRRVYTIPHLRADIHQAGLVVVREQGMLLKLLPQSMMTGFSEALLEGLMQLGEELPMEYACFLALDCRRAGQPGV